MTRFSPALDHSHPSSQPSKSIPRTSTDSLVPNWVHSRSNIVPIEPCCPIKQAILTRSQLAVIEPDCLCIRRMPITFLGLGLFTESVLSEDLTNMILLALYRIA
ncbi:hypothetical protein WG66_009439 [Moniliophthora roreri]|nr:hypothetical protein WG66_009439 [Moniliophthora roreri]